MIKIKGISKSYVKNLEEKIRDQEKLIQQIRLEREEDEGELRTKISILRKDLETLASNHQLLIKVNEDYSKMINHLTEMNRQLMKDIKWGIEP